MITSIVCCTYWPLTLTYIYKVIQPKICKKLLKYNASCHVCSKAPTVLDRFSRYCTQMITCMSGCVVHNDLSPWPVSFKSFCYDLTLKLLKYGTSCHACSTRFTVLNGCFPYLAQMISSMRGCVVCNNLWPCSLSSRSFSHEFVIKLLK